MKKVSGYISVRALGTYNYEFYVDDDATDEEIEQKVAEYEAYIEMRYRKR